jgi:transcriptional regulator with XRE-family HTH domain
MSATLEKLVQTVRARQELPPPSARRAVRQAAGVSLADVADVVGVSRQAVGLWERGLRNPRGRNLVAYLNVLRMLREAMSS